MFARSRLLLLVLSVLVLPGCLFLLDCSEGGRGRAKEETDSEESEPVSKKKRKKRAAERADVEVPSPEVPRPPRVPPAPSPGDRPTRPAVPTESPVPPPPPPAPVPTPASPSPAPPAEDRAQVKRWVMDVALGTEFPASGGPAEVVRRWTQPIRLSVMRGGRASRKDLDDVVSVLDGLLRPRGLSMEIVGDGDRTAKLQVFYAPSAELGGIASANGFSYLAGNDGFFYTFWNAAFELDRVYVLLATDKLSGTTMRHFTFEEVTQALGLARDSAIFSDSIFFASGDDGGKAQDLSELDRRLVTFLYAHTRPGDDRAALSTAFDRHWR
jgi:hypothetical protein